MSRPLALSMVAVAVATAISACGSKGNQNLERGCHGDAADKFERLNELPVLDDLPSGVTAVEWGGGCDTDDPDMPTASRTFTSVAAPSVLVSHFLRAATDAGWHIEQSEPLDGNGSRATLPTDSPAVATIATLMCSSKSLGDSTALLSLEQMGEHEYVWQASTAPWFVRGVC